MQPGSLAAHQSQVYVPYPKADQLESSAQLGLVHMAHVSGLVAAGETDDIHEDRADAREALVLLAQSCGCTPQLAHRGDPHCEGLSGPRLSPRHGVKT